MTGHGSREGVEQHEQAAATGIDHAGIGEHVELLDGLVECDHRRIRRCGDHAAEVGTV